jgi:Fe2+ transport system protein FeoA
VAKQIGTNMHSAMPLHLLATGAIAQISTVFGDAQQVHRLNELGFREGVRVRMVQPGKPCIVHVEGSRLCLRGDDSLGILVAPPEVIA